MKSIPDETLSSSIFFAAAVLPQVLAGKEGRYRRGLRRIFRKSPLTSFQTPFCVSSAKYIQVSSNRRFSLPLPFFASFSSFLSFPFTHPFAPPQLRAPKPQLTTAFASLYPSSFHRPPYPFSSYLHCSINSLVPGITQFCTLFLAFSFLSHLSFLSRCQ